MDMMKNVVEGILDNMVIELVIIAVVMDTVFGAARAIKYRQFNSSVGIDGAIRKISMLMSLVFLSIVDHIVNINLIGFVPQEARGYLPKELAILGLAEFFGLLYICYEVVSILKNMTLCGLPVKKLWVAIRNFLGKYTEELPDTEEQDKRQEREKENKQGTVAVATDCVPEGALDINPDGTVNAYDDDGNVVGYITKERVEELAAAVTEVQITESEG